MFLAEGDNLFTRRLAAGADRTPDRMRNVITQAYKVSEKILCLQL